MISGQAMGRRPSVADWGSGMSAGCTVSNCSLAWAMDSHLIRCCIISSCQSAATSEIIKRFWSRVWLSTKASMWNSTLNLMLCYVQRLVVCLETSLFVHNIHDMTVLHRICDTPLNPRGICALSASSAGTDGYLAYPGSVDVGEVQVFDAITLVCAFRLCICLFSPPRERSEWQR